MGLMRYKVFSLVSFVFYLLIYSNTVIADNIELFEHNDITIVGFGSCNE